MVTNLFAGVGLPALQQGACQNFKSLLINELPMIRKRQRAANRGKRQGLTARRQSRLPSCGKESCPTFPAP
jgi:hypothetical protein